VALVHPWGRRFALQRGLKKAFLVKEYKDLSTLLYYQSLRSFNIFIIDVI